MKIRRLPVASSSPCGEPFELRRPVAVDSFEHSAPSQKKRVALPRIGLQHVSKQWDVPGIITYYWFAAMVQGLKTEGDFNVACKNVGRVMAITSPVMVPLTLAADVVNTLIFPGKVICRALRQGKRAF